jgi:hypothetical protein
MREVAFDESDAGELGVERDHCRHSARSWSLRGRRHRGTLRGVTDTDQITFEFDPFDPRVLTVDGAMWMHTPLYGEQMRQV